MRQGERMQIVWAASAGDADLVSRLLARGEYVNFVLLDGSTPISEAARNGHADVVQILLDHGATPTQKDLEKARGEETKALLREALNKQR